MGRSNFPTLRKRLIWFWCDDTLDDEFDNNIANIKNQPNQDPAKRLIPKQAETTMAQLRIFQNFQATAFETDADIGIRSGDDVYLYV